MLPRNLFSSVTAGNLFKGCHNSRYSSKGIYFEEFLQSEVFERRLLCGGNFYSCDVCAKRIFYFKDSSFYRLITELVLERPELVSIKHPTQVLVYAT